MFADDTWPMYDDLNPTHRPPRILREFSPNAWVSAALFVIMAGPFNLAGLILGRPDPDNIILNSVPTLVFAILVPATVIALFMQDRMWRAERFTANDIVNWAGIGFFFAVLIGPLGFTIAGVYTDAIEWGDVGQMYFATLMFGTLIGVIPYFATFIGLPCVMVAIIAATLCTRPVKPTQ